MSGKKKSSIPKVTYAKSEDLHLSGTQINLVGRPMSRTSEISESSTKSRVVIKRPMSASSGTDYQVQHAKKLPAWSRPQSAGCSGVERRSKIAAKIYDQERDYYQTELGKTYTVSSSQLLQSLLGSCSLNEGLDSDTTAAPSPQPSLGETIKAAAQLSSLEPGLVSKPPLPPTPDIKSSKTSLCNDNHHSEEDELMDDKTMDEIIALKFQRWFPDSIVEQETASLTILQRKYPSDETTDDSDAGSRASLTEGELSVDYFAKKTVKSKSSDKNIKQKRNDGITLKKEPSKILKNRPMSSKPSNKTKRNVKSSKASDPLVKMREIDDLSSKISKILQQNSENLQPKIDFKLGSGESIIEEHFLNENDHCSLTMCERQNTIEDGMPFITGSCQNEEKCNQNESCNQSYSRNQSFSNLKKTESAIETHKQNIENKANFNENNLLNSISVGNENQKDNYVAKDEDLVGKNYVISNENKKPEHSENVTGKDVSPLQNMNCINNNSVKITVSPDNSPPSKEESADTSARTTENPNYLTVGREQVPGFLRKSSQESSASKDVLGKMEYQNTENITFNETRNNNFLLYDFKSLENIEKYLTDTDYTKDKNDVFSVSNSSLLPGISSEHSSQVNSALYITEVSNEHNVKVNTTYYTLNGNKDKSNPNDFGMSGPVKSTKFSSSFNNTSSLQEIPERDVSGTSYEDIVNMLQVLEKEDLRSSVPTTTTTTTTTPVVYEPPQPKPITMLDSSSSARAIFNFLDEVDRFSPVFSSDAVKHLPTPTTTGAVSTLSKELKIQIPSNSRFGELLNKNSADLAQKVMKLTLDLEEKCAEFEVLEERYRELQAIIRQLKEQIDMANKKHQKFAEQVLNEKKQMREKFDKMMKAVELKHENTIQVIEERHKIEMKREKEKFSTAEKIRRERWIDQKTKKIKEMTVRGLEPELERMARLHQEEISELRRLHQRQLEEAEAGWVRRSAAQKEQEKAEREAAVQHEREAARHRLEQEIAELEKSYQEQRKRLLEEVRQEQETIQKDGEAILEEKRKELTKELETAQQKVESKLKEQEKAHQNEIKKLRSSLEEEKQAWINQQNAKLLEKQASMTEQCKRERDRQIELVIRRLESEASDKEQTLNSRMIRMKESHDNEVHQLESELEEIKQKLKDARSKAQLCEDSNTQTLAELRQAQTEITVLKQAYERLKEDNTKLLQERDAKIQSLHCDLTQAMQLYQEQIRTIHDDKEKQLQQVYTRVKEAVNKKEETLKIMQQQRDAALEQCSRLEKILEQRKDGRFK